MIVAGVTLLAVGTAALASSVAMEFWKKEPVYMIIMKISAGLFAIGTIIFGIGMGLD